MMKKIGAAILTILIGFSVATPVQAASNSSKTTIKKLEKKLKSIPDGTGTSSQVSGLAKKLAKLDPKKAAKYFKIAVDKFNPQTAQADAEGLAKKLTKIVDKADLPEKKIEKVVKQIEKELENVPPPSPTPTPYSALWQHGAIA